MSKQHKYRVHIWDDDGHVISVQVNNWVFQGLHKQAFKRGVKPMRYIADALIKAAKRPRRFRLFGFLLPAGGENDTM